jgi:3-phenylpropionate/trans-cinnamate dioxygenase ferredoxin component
MADWFQVGPTGDVTEGEINSYTVGDRIVAVANVEGDLFGFDDVCTHQGCSLSEGELEGTTVECPCHGSRFDLMTGEVVNGPADEPIDVFEVRDEDQGLEVAIG